MNIKINFSKAYIMLVPVLGVGLFVLLYLISAKQYPGGSWNYTNDTGFSFWHNYLCDLLDDYAINGEINNGRFFARSALGILCLSIMLIWIYIPKLFVAKSHYLSVSRWSGLLSLIILFFLNFGTHDLIVRIAGFFGVVALFTCLLDFYKTKNKLLFCLGLFCLIIFFGNYFIYETGVSINVLPVLQKVTFITFIVWFLFIDFLVYRKLKLANEKEITR